MLIFDFVSVSDHVSATQQWQRSISSVLKLQTNHDHVLVSKLYRLYRLYGGDMFIFLLCGNISAVFLFIREFKTSFYNPIKSSNPPRC